MRAAVVEEAMTFASYHTRAESAQAAAALSSGDLDASGLVTASITLDELPEMIGSLTLTMNKIRQAAITREIIEVVSGSQAL